MKVRKPKLLAEPRTDQPCNVYCRMYIEILTNKYRVCTILCIYVWFGPTHLPLIIFHKQRATQQQCPTHARLTLAHTYFSHCLYGTHDCLHALVNVLISLPLLHHSSSQ